MYFLFFELVVIKLDFPLGGFGPIFFSEFWGTFLNLFLFAFCNSGPNKKLIFSNFLQVATNPHCFVIL